VNPCPFFFFQQHPIFLTTRASAVKRNPTRNTLSSNHFGRFLVTMLVR
jgi:hypothetical protein